MSSKELEELASKLAPEDFEKALIEKELQSQKDEVGDPRDAYANLFHFYSPRLEGQTNFMSKKQLITLMSTLAGSDHNKKEDMAKIPACANKLNLKAIRRVLMGVIENPLNDERLRLLTKNEVNLFMLFDGLMTNKYYNCIREGLLQKQANVEIEKIEDIIKHQVDTNSSEFKSRERQEKDAFALGNKLWASKALIFTLSISMEYTNEEVKLEGDKNGK